MRKKIPTCSNSALVHVICKITNLFENHKLLYVLQKLMPIAKARHFIIIIILLLEFLLQSAFMASLLASLLSNFESVSFQDDDLFYGPVRLGHSIS